MTNPDVEADAASWTAVPMSVGPAPSMHVQSTPPMKLWQAWPGNQVFLRDGQWVLSQKWPCVLGTIAVIVGPEVVFLAFVAPKISPPWNWASMMIIIILATLACIFVIQTCVTDPGILPLLSPDDAYLRQQKPREREVTVNGMSMVLRYDDTYHFYRPPRAHHCHDTNVVIERFDHFCPWMGNTIGLRNYRPFVLTLATVFLIILITAGFCVLLILEHFDDEGSNSRASYLERMEDIAAAPVLLLVAFVFGLPVTGLLCFHFYLVSRGMTTYENIRGYGGIFSQGCTQNWHELCCLPVPDPFVDFTQSVEEGQRAVPPKLIRDWNPPWCNA